MTMISNKLVTILLLIPAAFAAQAPHFAPPAPAPTVASANYTGANNGTLPKPTVVPGKSFDRFIQIWLENTDYNDAATTSAFRALQQQGILLDNFYALTHPSEPNYAASVAGDFWGMADDAAYRIPANISTIVDLLEDKNISWASYQENMPYDGYEGASYASKNYLNSSASNYTYYVRKHNPTVLYESVSTVPSRLALHRNFNDFAADVNADVLPQWLFVTPNIVNDGHDTSVDFESDWLNYWLLPLLVDPNFNNDRTLILLTFDENETYNINNHIFTLALGGAIPEHLRNTSDHTFYTHYSMLSTVQANWGLKCLGRQDTNKTVSNVFSFVAETVGYQNVNITDAQIPLTNLSGIYPGPLNNQHYIPFTAPNMSAIGAGGQGVFVAPSLNVNFTPTQAPAPVNLTALGKVNPYLGVPNASTTTTGPASSTSVSGALSDNAHSAASLALSCIFAALSLTL